MNKDKKPASEEKTATASYIITFYQNVQQLTNEFANYINLMLVSEGKIKDANKASEEDKQALLNNANNLRYYAVYSFIQYHTIKAQLKQSLDPEIVVAYSKIKTSLIINREDIEKYVLAFHKELSNQIMKELLTTSQDILNNVFSNE